MYIAYVTITIILDSTELSMDKYNLLSCYKSTFIFLLTVYVPIPRLVRKSICFIVYKLVYFFFILVFRGN